MSKRRIQLDPAAELKVKTSLRLLEDAQNGLYAAAQELCSVRGFAPEWTRLCRGGDSAKKLWYDIAYKLTWEVHP